jgi:hypothetical protein
MYYIGTKSQITYMFDPSSSDPYSDSNLTSKSLSKTQSWSTGTCLIPSQEVLHLY